MADTDKLSCSYHSHRIRKSRHRMVTLALMSGQLTRPLVMHLEPTQTLGLLPVRGPNWEQGRIVEGAPCNRDPIVQRLDPSLRAIHSGSIQQPRNL